MRALVLLFLLVAVGFFLWRYVLRARVKRLAGKWGGRVVVTASLAAGLVLSLFAVLALSTWRIF